MAELRRDNVFVVGCQRSGTSAVWAGLTAHPDLAPLRGYDRETGYDPKELYYFANLFAGRRQFASPMYGWPVDALYLRKIVDATIEHCIEQHGSRAGRFVNAHPRDGIYLEEILETMPEARIVCVLRHPQEVVWSTAHAPWSESDARTNPATLRRFAMHWREHARVARRVIEGRFGESVLLVRHEVLVEDPSGTAERLAEHVGVSPDPVMAAQLGSPTFNSSFRDRASAKVLIPETRRMIARAQEFRRIVFDSVSEDMEALGYSDLGNPPLVPRRGPRAGLTVED